MDIPPVSGTGAVRPLTNPHGQNLQPPAVLVTAASQELSPAPVSRVSSSHGRTIDTISGQFAGPPRCNAHNVTIPKKKSTSGSEKADQLTFLQPPPLPRERANPASHAALNQPPVASSDEPAPLKRVGQFLAMRLKGMERINRNLDEYGKSTANLKTSTSKLRQNVQDAVTNGRSVLERGQSMVNSIDASKETVKKYTDKADALLKNL